MIIRNILIYKSIIRYSNRKLVLFWLEYECVYLNFFKRTFFATFRNRKKHILVASTHNSLPLYVSPNFQMLCRHSNKFFCPHFRHRFHPNYLKFIENIYYIIQGMCFFLKTDHCSELTNSHRRRRYLPLHADYQAGKVLPM